MPVPNEAHWGPDGNGGSLDYGQVRAITNDSERIRLLKLRLEALFINSCEVLYTTKSAFPLVTMTCIGIEALASIFESDKLKKAIAEETTEEKEERKKKKKKGQRASFIAVCCRFDQRLAQKFSKKFRTKLEQMWPDNKDIHEIDCLAGLIYRYLRNELVHGFQAKGVYLDYNDTDTFFVNEESAYMVINPGWFWLTYKKVFNKYFDELVTEGSKARNNCTQRISDMLK
ncbi:MAG: hypothetical protein H6594_06475 [Flavobacteriales bacterium]|nr:hypothetical protein [Flavobacteriales bacterium]